LNAVIKGLVERFEDRESGDLNNSREEFLAPSDLTTYYFNFRSLQSLYRSADKEFEAECVQIL
jgi:hypothetical protein